MARIEPLARAELEAFEPLFQAVEQTMGFVPNSLFTMGHQPALLENFTALARTVLAPGGLPRELKQLVAFVTSNASGCRYCQAHTSHSAVHAGAPREKIQAAFEYDTNPLFSDAERCALRLAAAAGLVPNQATDEHFNDLRRHFNDAQLVELVSVISLFGWLNRWNDTLATKLEDTPAAFADQVLTDLGWTLSKHA